jgi:site-specific DNA-cytosine methylase
MRFASLFAGIGGIDLGLERAGMTCAAQVEIDPFASAVLQKHWPHVPRFSDVRNFGRESINESLDVVCGGFPCQDISVAGKGAGLAGGRSGLWFEMLRIIREFRPRWIVAENVPALRSRGGDVVIAGLEESGYAVWPSVVGAWAVGAPHKRDRAWIVAKLVDADRFDLSGQTAPERWSRLAEGYGGSEELAGRLADADGVGDGRRRPVSQRESAWRIAVEGAGRGGGECFACGYGFDVESAGRYGCPNCHGEGLADADGVGRKSGRERIEGRVSNPSREAGVLAESASQRLEGPRQCDARPFAATSPFAWPARPGQQQHAWESPRLIKWPMGSATDGLPVGLVRLAGRKANRIARFANAQAVKAAGNSVVPQIPYLIGLWIMQQEAAAAAANN